MNSARFVSSRAMWGQQQGCGHTGPPQQGMLCQAHVGQLLGAGSKLGGLPRHSAQGSAQHSFGSLMWAAATNAAPGSGPPVHVAHGPWCVWRKCGHQDFNSPAQQSSLTLPGSFWQFPAASACLGGLPRHSAQGPVRRSFGGLVWGAATSTGEHCAAGYKGLAGRKGRASHSTRRPGQQENLQQRAALLHFGHTFPEHAITRA